MQSGAARSPPICLSGIEKNMALRPSNELLRKKKAGRIGIISWQKPLLHRPGRGESMFLPHMSAAGCPVVDARSLGAFVGLSNFVQRGDMLRAIVEGLDYQVLDIVTALKNGLGINRRPACSGGRRHAQSVLDAEQSRYHRSANRCARSGRGHASRRGHPGRYWDWLISKRAGCF